MVAVAKMVPLDEFDLSIQTRAAIDRQAVLDYAARLKSGEPMDPAVAFQVGDGPLVLSCGFHRRLAYREAGLRVRLFLGVGRRGRAVLSGLRCEPSRHAFNSSRVK